MRSDPIVQTVARFDRNGGCPNKPPDPLTRVPSQEPRLPIHRTAQQPQLINTTRSGSVFGDFLSLSIST